MIGANRVRTTVRPQHDTSLAWSTATFGPSRTDGPTPLMAAHTKVPNMRARFRAKISPPVGLFSPPQRLEAGSHYSCLFG
jgi:hypothetical protein